MTKAYTQLHIFQEWRVQINNVLEEDMSWVTGWEMMGIGLEENYLR